MNADFDKIKELIESDSLEERSLGITLFDQVRDATIFPILEKGNFYYIGYRTNAIRDPFFSLRMRKFIGVYEASGHYDDGINMLFTNEEKLNVYISRPDILFINAL